MGARTGLLVYSDGAAPDLLKRVGAPDLERTTAMMRCLYPGWGIEATSGSTLADGAHPPDGRVYAGSWPGVDLVCDGRVMVDLPSRLPDELVAASAGRRMVLHAMHSVVDWLAFGVWEDGRLIRSLSLSPDSGIAEDIGDPLAFEQPYWAGDRAAGAIAWPGEDERPYPLPFHPLDMGEDALRALCGFVLEGRPEPRDVEADAVDLHGFLVRDPNAPDPAEKEAALRAAVAAMGPPRAYLLGADGTLVEREAPGGGFSAA
ncbi:hypothetical protein OG500_01395 [Kitasatospora sp. NBC_01250]|uniref:DUF6928 family protein n=1 Tax=Kitasatospora sp. NBC_01250 TaxID=2903571 RepID=UPI002E3355B1|nr:hypothetical protein [Kitasatospora sp. NBC_01250]